MSRIVSHYLQMTSWLNAEEGQDLVEYALIIGLVSLFLVAALGVLADGIDGLYTRVNAVLGGITP